MMSTTLHQPILRFQGARHTFLENSKSPHRQTNIEWQDLTMLLNQLLSLGHVNKSENAPTADPYCLRNSLTR